MLLHFSEATRMKITRKQLNKIIKESLSLLTEDTYHTVEGECVDGLWLSIDVVKIVWLRWKTKI